MKAFHNGVEIRLTKEDLNEALTYWLKHQVIKYDFKGISVVDSTLHPGNKYVIKMTLDKQT